MAQLSCRFLPEKVSGDDQHLRPRFDLPTPADFASRAPRHPRTHRSTTTQRYRIAGKGSAMSSGVSKSAKIVLDFRP
jgi:hypothetical protein